MLDLIADLENNANSEVEEEGEVYHELEENVEVKSLEELQEHYSQIKNSEVCKYYFYVKKSLTYSLCRCQKITNYQRTAHQRTFTNWWRLYSFPPEFPCHCLQDINSRPLLVLPLDINDLINIFKINIYQDLNIIYFFLNMATERQSLCFSFKDWMILMNLCSVYYNLRTISTCKLTKKKCVN